MLASFLITFREALEAALIVGILAAYLSKINRKDLNKYLWMGTLAAIFASSAIGLLFMQIYGGFEGRQEEIFEGLASLTAVAVLTYMIFWMTKNASHIKGELQEKVDISISNHQMYGIASLAFVAVFREEMETVLFIGTLALRDPSGAMIGLAEGLASVVALALFAYKGVYKLNIRKFFRYTSAILLVFAAGLSAYGVQELNEAVLIPPVIEHLWDINPPVSSDGTYPLLHEKGAVGSILKSLFGYNGNPSLTELIAYIFYWLSVGTYLLFAYRHPRELETEGLTKQAND